MKKTMMIIFTLVVLVSSAFTQDLKLTEAEDKAREAGRSIDTNKQAAAVYTLVKVDESNIPGVISHGGHDIMLHSGTFIIATDETCISKTVFGSQKIDREVKGSYTQVGSTLNVQWLGAGQTQVTIHGDTLTMNNEGMKFIYKTKVQEGAMHAYDLRMQGRITEAKEFVEKWLEEHPEDAKAWFELARLEMYLKPGDSHAAFEQALKAERTIKKSNDLDPDNPRAQFLEGHINKSLGLLKLFTKGMPGDANFANAVKHYERAIELKPDYHEVRQELIEFHHEKWPLHAGADKTKAAAYTEILWRDPVYRATLQCAEKSREEKLAIWQKVITEHKDNPAVYAQAALEYMYKRADKPMSDMEKAHEYLDRAIDLDPSQSIHLLDLAESYRWRKDFEGEEEALRQFLILEEMRPLLQAEGLYLLAENMKVQGKSEEASELMSEAKRINPIKWQSTLPESECYSKP